MMRIGEAPALRSIEREEPATRSDEPGEGGVEGKKMLTFVERIGGFLSSFFPFQSVVFYLNRSNLGEVLP